MNYGAKICRRGPTSQRYGQRCNLPLGRTPCLCGAMVARLPMPFGHEFSFTLEKIEKILRTFRCHLCGGTWAELFCSSAECFCQEKFPPGGANRSLPHQQHSVHHADHHLHHHLMSQTLVLPLCSIFKTNLIFVHLAIYYYG